MAMGLAIPGNRAVVVADILAQGASAERARIQRAIHDLRAKWVASLDAQPRTSAGGVRALDEALRACRAPRRRRSK